MGFVAVQRVGNFHVLDHAFWEVIRLQERCGNIGAENGVVVVVCGNECPNRLQRHHLSVVVEAIWITGGPFEVSTLDKASLVRSVAFDVQ